MANASWKYGRTAKICPGLNTVRHHIFVRGMAVVLALATMNLAQGCYYFKVNTRYKPAPEMISGLDQSGKNLILHFNENRFRLTDVSVSNQVLSGNAKPVGPGMYDYPVKADRPNRYFKRAGNNQSWLINEVHLYADEYVDLGNSRISVPVSSISKIDIYDRDTATTTGSWILSGLGALASIYLVMAILILIFKQSCPFIYVYDGHQYHFTGEVFSGAIQPGLERDDYLLLPDIQPDDGEYLLKVTNEVREIQHINLMELNVIDHGEDVKVMIDKYGRLHTLTGQVFPAGAFTVDGNDILSLIAGPDEYAYFFNGSAATGNPYDEIILTFPKPAGAEEGKLIIRAKNSLWVEHVFASFHKLLGGKYPSFDRKGSARPAEEMRELMYNQGFPLSVYIEEDGEWQFVDFYEIAGPMAMKDDILSIPFTGSGSETVKIKLKTGFMFWEMDYAAMDFSGNIPLEVTRVPAKSAIDENGTDVLDNMLANDQKYYVQPDTGNEANLVFGVPGQSGESRTVILHSRGYYKILRDQKGQADLKQAKTFRQPGRMAQFSKELFENYNAITQK